MKLQHSLLLIANSMMLLSACMKNSSTQSKSSDILPGTVPAFSIPVTDAQAAILDTLRRQGKMTSPMDFRRMVDSVKLAWGGKEPQNSVAMNRTLDGDGDYNPSSETNSNAIATDAATGQILSEDIFHGTKVIETSFEKILTFAIRGNQMKVIVPFKYTWGTNAAGGTYSITNVVSTTQVQLLPFGAYWGDVTQGPVWYVNSGFSTDPWQHSAGINAYGTMQEKRTRIISTTGATKISTNVDVEVFKIGTEMQAGFTIQSVNNIYNQYSMNATGQVWIGQTIYNPSLPPTTQFQGNMSASDAGILRNE